MIKKVIKGPSNTLTTLSPERPETPWTLNDQLEGEEYILEEPVAESSDSDDGGEDTADDGYCDAYSDDFEDDDEEEKGKTDETIAAVDFRTIQLEHDFRLLVPYNATDVSDNACKIEILSAERRTELLSNFKHLSDDIMISDAYEVKYLDERITTNTSRSMLVFPVDLPNTRLDNDVLYRFHVMARERNGDWKKIPADYKKSELIFPVRSVMIFIAYAQPIAEFTDVTSSGFTFQSAKNTKFSLEIPKGAVDGEIRIGVKIRPVNMDRMHAHTASEPQTSDGIYALTDILYVRHPKDAVLQHEGSVRLPLDGVARDHEIKCLTKTSGNYEIIDIDKNQALKDGQVEVPYKGDPKMSYQVLCTRPGANEEQIERDAAYLTGQIDSCTILFFLSKSNKDRFLTVEFVDKTVEVRVLRNRSERGFYEIKNSRLSGLEVGKKRRIRVELGGNMQSAKLKKNTRFTFVYNSGCKNNSIEFKTAKNPQGHHYSIVKILFNNRKVHEIHFYYPDIGRRLEDIHNLIYKLMPKNINESNSEANAKPEPKPEAKPKQEPESEPEPKPKPESEPKPKPEPEPESESEPVPEPKPEREPKPEEEQEPEPQPQPQSNSNPEPKPDHLSLSNLPSQIPSPRPTTAFTDCSSIPEKEHPLLQNKSLVTLGDVLPPEKVSDLMIRADFQFHEIDEIRRIAKDSGYKPNTRLLDAWKRRTKSEVEFSDSKTLDCLVDELNEIGRADIANILKKIRKKKHPRVLKKMDFV